MLKIITHGTNCIKIIASKSAQVPRTYFILKCVKLQGTCLAEPLAFTMYITMV